MNPLRNVLRQPIVKVPVENALTDYVKWRNRTRPPYQFIHILSHMRSGSSLLSHILFSHPEVLGFGETQLPIRTPRDFDRLVAKVLRRRGRLLFCGQERYILDKSLHDSLLAPEQANLLATERSRVVFLVRNPIEAIPSIIKLMAYTPQQAIDYYVGRLGTLVRYARIICERQPCLLVKHSELIYDTEASFAALQRFLRLQRPLSEQYKALDSTGLFGVGDTSPTIRSGRIVRGKHAPPPSDDWRRAGPQYQEAVEELERLCLPVHRSVGSRPRSAHERKSSPSSSSPDASPARGA